MTDEAEWDPGSEYFEKEEAATRELDDKGMRSRKVYSVRSSNPTCTVDSNLRQISSIYTEDLAFLVDRELCATQRQK